VTAGHPRSVSGPVSTIFTSLAAGTKASGTVWPGGPPVIFSATSHREIQLVHLGGGDNVDSGLQ
jgi:hypothetical protein